MREICDICKRALSFASFTQQYDVHPQLTSRVNSVSTFKIVVGDHLDLNSAVLVAEAASRIFPGTGRGSCPIRAAAGLRGGPEVLRLLIVVDQEP